MGFWIRTAAVALAAILAGWEGQPMPFDSMDAVKAAIRPFRVAPTTTTRS